MSDAVLITLIIVGGIVLIIALSLIYNEISTRLALKRFKRRTDEWIAGLKKEEDDGK